MPGIKRYPFHLTTAFGGASPQGEALARRWRIINNGCVLNQRSHRVVSSQYAQSDREAYSGAGFRPCADLVGYDRDAKTLYAIACIEGGLGGDSWWKNGCAILPSFCMLVVSRFIDTACLSFDSAGRNAKRFFRHGSPKRAFASFCREIYSLGQFRFAELRGAAPANCDELPFRAAPACAA